MSTNDWPKFRREKNVIFSKTVQRRTDGKDHTIWESEKFDSINSAKRKSREIQLKHGTLGCGVLEVIRGN